MEYIKMFEDYIKHSDPDAANHVLRDFSRKVEDLVIAVDDNDVKRYFHDNGSIDITSRNKNNILKIKLKQELDSMIFIIQYSSWTLNQNFIDFYNFIRYNLIEYVIGGSPDHSSSHRLLVKLLIDMNEIDVFLKKLEEYYIYLDSKKYNL
jgi:hypothetical protein